MMTEPATITLPIRLVSEANTREHWRTKAKRAKRQRQTCFMFTLSRIGEEAPTPAVVTITRIAPRPFDGDNLQRSAKACRDGIADALGIDDGDARVRWEYAQRRGKPKEYAVEIEIAWGERLVG